MKNSRLNTLIKIVSVICVISLLLTSCVADVNRYENAEYINAKYSGNKFHKTSKSAYSVVSKSGLIELLFDKDTTAVAIRDTNSGAVWSALPDTGVKKEIQSYAVELTLSDGGNKIYKLNSQDNSVAHGNFTYTASVDGISVTYAMALDKETGAKELRDFRAELGLSFKGAIAYTYKDFKVSTTLALFTPYQGKGYNLKNMYEAKNGDGSWELRDKTANYFEWSSNNRYFGHFDVDWDVAMSYQFLKCLQVTLQTSLKYYPGTLIANHEGIQSERVQFKGVIGVGVGYSF